MIAQDRHVSAYAPGRVELLGNHTDYNEGVVLGAAIDRGLTVSGASRDDEIISLRSTSTGRVELPVAALQPQQNEKRWANYALGVVHELIAAGVSIRGFTAEIDGDVPAGNGLSSSAAFEVATALFLLKLFHRELPPLQIAKICQRAEHEFVGVKSGLLDQVMSIFGQADHAVFFDVRTEEVGTIPFPRDLALVIAQSGTNRELIGGKYNQRRAETRAAAEALGVRALRDVSSRRLNEDVDLAPLLRRRATHIVGENARVLRAVELLERGDAIGFGALMNESHESSRINFENSTPELDLLVDLARALPGALGARLTGGGFGGATVTLCRRENAADISENLRAAYKEQRGIDAQVFLCRVANGAR